MVGIRPLSLALLTFALLVPASASAAPTRIIVKRDGGLTGAEQRDIRADAGVRLAERLTVPDLEVVTVRSADARAALARLNRDPDVELAEIDGKVHAFDHGQPDPFLDQMWWFQNAGDPDQVAYKLTETGKVRVPTLEDADMNVPEAWTMSEGAGTLIAVADSGVSAAHPDLAGRIAPGYDWVDEDTDPADEDGHGTHVTGTIAADANNGIGGAGVAPDARVLPMRVLDENGSGNVSSVIEAFHFAGQQGIRIVNASFGAANGDPLERAEIAKWPDTLFVTAAGNEGGNDDVASHARYPCAFDLPNVLCVGGSTAMDERASWSNYGAHAVDVYAPGEGILATYLGNGYAYSSGTSMAAPQVAGIAALLLARDPNLATSDLKQAIIDTVHTRPGLTSVSGGRVDAAAALAAVPEDPDNDQVVGLADNCPAVFNPDQVDSDPDQPGGDACADGAAAPDRDGDQILDDEDACPFQFGPAETKGCPGLAEDANHDGLLDVFDADGDGISDNADKCPRLAGDSQVDSDGDGIGNECDSTPRGPDVDHDGKPALDDACPTVYGTLPNGCPKPVAKPTPTPTPTPRPTAKDRDHDGRLDGVDSCPTEPAATPNGCPLPYVTALSAKGRKRAATIKVATSRAASVRITVQRKRGHRWRKVTKRVRLSSGNRVTLKLKHLRKGSYRVLVVVSSPAGTAAQTTKRFRVR